MCVEGKCIVDTGQCSPASCPTGCCEGTVCVQRGDQDWLACGTEAAECETCNTATVCDEGTCTDTFASGDLVGIRIHAVEVETTDDGENWDLLGGAPDLFVCVTDGVFEGCTTAGSDTFAVDWGVDGVLTDTAGVEVYFSTDDLIEGNLEYGVFDDDVDGRYLAQSGFLPSTSVFEGEYAIAQRGPNLVLLTYSILLRAAGKSRRGATHLLERRAAATCEPRSFGTSRQRGKTSWFRTIDQSGQASPTLHENPKVAGGRFRPGDLLLLVPTHP